MKRVSPWLVELVSNMPLIHLSPFSPPRKKLRIPQPPNFPSFKYLREQFWRHCSELSDGSVVVQDGPVESSSDEAGPWCKDQKSKRARDRPLQDLHGVGRRGADTQISLLFVHTKSCTDMFGREKPVMLKFFIYRDLVGAVKHTGDEPFSEFSKTTQRLTIVTDSDSYNVGLTY